MSDGQSRRLVKFPFLLSVAKLDGVALMPENCQFWSLTVSPIDGDESNGSEREFSLVCDSETLKQVAVLRAEPGWVGYRLFGQIPFDECGVISSLSRPLADAEIPIFVVSTYDTDVVLVPEIHASRAEAAWEEMGYRVL